MEKNIPVPLLDVPAQIRQIRSEALAKMESIMDSGRFILGAEVESFEHALASYCGVPHAVGLSSGTDALLVALMALEIGPGDEVITTPYTFFATAGSIVRLGATPVFVDINPATFTIDCEAVKRAITSKTKAIIPVHLYGRCADMMTLMEIACRHKIPVIEDAAQAIGSGFRGVKAGALGDMACFSFFPSKNLGCFGDGGLLTTANSDLYEKVVRLRNHGMHPKYYHSMVGGNFRLDALQAGILNVKLPYLDLWCEKRRANAQSYVGKFAAKKLDAFITAPSLDDAGHSFNQFVIRAKKRDDLLKHLQSRSIGCEIYYPLPLHVQECFAGLGYKAGDFPESERAANETLALPIFPELTEEQIDAVVAGIESFYR